MPTTVTHTDLPGLELVHRGKVRDVYAVDADSLLIVATDRISAFDRILGSGIPGKGVVLCQTARFWFKHLVVENHLITGCAAEMPAALQPLVRDLGGRAMLVRKVEIVPIECVVRGYLAGSVVEAYRRDGAIQGEALPPGIPLGGELPQPIFTPTTKAASGHDQPLTFAELAGGVGEELAHELRKQALRVFGLASAHCRERGLLLCDTKFEFGRLPDGRLILADEVLTPDSSRFFRAESHVPGEQPQPWDKQLVRDYLIAHPELKEGEAPPALPAEIVAETARRYAEVYALLSGRPLEEAVAEAVA
ncbi:MAG: phosphoribosylaminoimidazolesuccinocarboxamide synthase [Planctomycetota bacterium]